MTEFATALWQVMLELSPWLILGSVIAGLLHAFIPSSLIQKQFHGVGGIFKAVVLGVPLPLCSCGVIPAGLGLKKDGASDAATVGFLISTPQTGVDSILVSASFLGWPFAIFKVVAAFITGIIGGLICTLFPDQQPPASSTCDSSNAAKARPTFKESAEHGMDIIQSIWRWLAFGVIVSAALEVWLPPSWLGTLGSTNPTTIHLLVLAMSIPLYVCATASVPIAAALVAGGLPPGAALVFLMAGPATNVSTLGAVFKGIGKRAGIVYFSTLIAGSLILAFVFDQIMTLEVLLPGGHHEHSAWWQSISAAALTLLMLYFAVEELKLYLGKLRAPAYDLSIEVSGMTCNGCVGKLQKTLAAHELIQNAQVQLTPGQAQVSGSIDQESLKAVIKAAGFTPGALH